MIEIIKKNNTSSIPQVYVDLLIAAEDHRFMQHRGIDPIAIIRATYKTCFFGKLEGGSTIAMQLARVISGKYEKSLSRKLQEMIYAHKITKFISREEIPRIYLSIAYFGHGMTGIENACKKIGMDINSCSKTQAAEIIARLKYPEPSKPSKSINTKISQRAKHIIRRHQENRCQFSIKKAGA